MSRSRFFCSVAARANNESLYGTVARRESWLLLEYPGPWRRNALECAELPVAVRGWLEDTAQRLPLHRQVLIRQGHTAPAAVRCFFVETRESGSRLMQLELPSYDELGCVDVAAMPEHPGARTLPGPLYLVCTHGTHDKCCAKFGLPVYGALRAHAGESVWQCSHIGGDRFAANVLCFPDGVYYGFVEPGEAVQIAQAAADGEVRLENYRGRCCYPRAAQIAEYFLRLETGIRRIDALRLLTIKRRGGDGWSVRFAVTGGSDYLVEIEPADESLTQPLTCTSESASSIPQYRLVRCEPVSADQPL